MSQQRCAEDEEYSSAAEKPFRITDKDVVSFLSAYGEAHRQTLVACTTTLGEFTIRLYEDIPCTVRISSAWSTTNTSKALAFTAWSKALSVKPEIPI